MSDVIDSRRAPDVLGVVAGRAVRSPGDVDAWLRSILGGLENRGLGVTFGKSAPNNGIVAQFDLKKAWLSDIKTSKAATVVVHVSVARAGAQLMARDYRGSLTKINWASTDTELQHLVDGAFTKVLDEMAADIHKICPYEHG